MSQTIGHGSQFEIDVLTNGTFTNVLGVVSADFGSNKIDTPETTDFGTTGTQKTYIGGLENPGDLTIKLNVKPGDATQAAVFTCKDGVQRNMKVIYPGSVRTKAFAGIITSIDESIPDDKLPTYTVKVQITGPVTIS